MCVAAPIATLALAALVVETDLAALARRPIAGSAGRPTTRLEGVTGRRGAKPRAPRPVAAAARLAGGGGSGVAATAVTPTSRPRTGLTTGRTAAALGRCMCKPALRATPALAALLPVPARAPFAGIVAATGAPAFSTGATGAPAATTRVAATGATASAPAFSTAALLCETYVMALGGLVALCTLWGASG